MFDDDDVGRNPPAAARASDCAFFTPRFSVPIVIG